MSLLPEGSGQTYQFQVYTLNYPILQELNQAANLHCR